MNHILNIVKQTAQVAGEIILSYYHSEYEVKMKGKGNPVTDADIAADDKLKEILTSKFPDYGWLSEETQDTSERLTKKRVWVVDPIDGTKEFVEGIPNFVVSIGLVEDGVPILGVIYNPVNKEIYTSIKGGGTYYNDSPVSISKKDDLSNMRMLNSRSESRKGLWDPYKKYFHSVEPIGSIAYKLALTASGKTDIIASLRPKNEWDLCAGHCLINEAGGILLTTEGKEITYNNQNTLITPGLISSNETAVKHMLNLINIEQ